MKINNLAFLVTRGQVCDRVYLLYGRGMLDNWNEVGLIDNLTNELIRGKLLIIKDLENKKVKISIK